MFRRRAARHRHFEPLGRALRAAPDPRGVGAAAALQHGDPRRALRLLQVADIGDVATNAYDLKESIGLIEAPTTRSSRNGCRPMSSAATTRSRCRSCARAQEIRQARRGPCRRACRRERHDVRREDRARHAVSPRVEDGLLDCDQVAQIGLRGTGYTPTTSTGAAHRALRRAGRECWYKSLAPLMEEVRARVGRCARLSELRHRRPRPGVRARHRHARDRRPDRAARPGNRARLAGLERRRRRPVEVSPPYDRPVHRAGRRQSAFEMLCVMPGVTYRQSTRG